MINKILKMMRKYISKHCKKCQAFRAGKAGIEEKGLLK